MKQWIKIKIAYMKGIWQAYTRAESMQVDKEKKQAYIMLAANYNNLGDIAITYAQEKYIRKVLEPDYEVIVVPHDKTYSFFRQMKKNIDKDSIITLIGGGNSGTLYEFIEEPRRFILKFFKECRIISFPQSVLYDDSKAMFVYKTEFVKLCKKCKKLTLVAREEQSYHIYKKLVGNTTEVLLTPDIVFSLELEHKEVERRGVCFIFRNDKEKALSEQNQYIIEDKCKRKFGSISYNDTCAVEIVGNGYAELSTYINLISKKSIIVTDRLHGMVLAYITNTPCIAIDNNNHKIESTYYTWLKDQSLIYMIHNECDMENAINLVLKGQRKDLKQDLDVIKIALKGKENGR